MEIKYDEITIDRDGEIIGYWNDNQESNIHPVFALLEYEKVAQMYEAVAYRSRERVEAIELHGIDDIVDSIRTVGVYARAISDWHVGSDYVHTGRGNEYSETMSRALPQLKERIFKLRDQAELLRGIWELFTDRPFPELPEF